MYSLLKAPILKILKVPPEPEDPFGNSRSLKVFRAAEGYFHYKLITFLIGQLFAFIGLVVGVVIFFIAVSSEIQDPTLRTIVLVIEVGAVLFFFLQLLLNLALLRLEYELRWYKITDRSLRIREGVWSVREMTMSFANIQNISISQGPLQRLFKIADLKVQSAGGGGVVEAQQAQQSGAVNMHLGYFRGVDNAEEIRDLMRERLRRLRDSGLGDHDESADEVPADVTPPTQPSLQMLDGTDWQGLLADLRGEAKAFRAAAERLSSAPRQSNGGTTETS
ncbi:MAG: PH domain-containing protein [Sumerlaeia bacterium]